MESVFDEEKKEAIIQYCNFAFKNIYGETDKFTHENGKDIESLISFLQTGNGGNWINIINFSCNTSFQIKSKIRRFNLIEPSEYIMKKFNVSFSYTLDVLFILMEIYVFKTTDIEPKIKIIRALFHIYDYNPKDFEDGINFLQIIKKSCNADISGVNDDPDSRFNFFYDFLQSQDVDIFFDKGDFKNIYKSETLVLFHLGQLLNTTGNFDFDIPPEQILGKTNQIIKSLLFFEIFYINKTDILHLKPQKITFGIDINNKTVKMTQFFDNEEDLGIFYLIKAKEATLFYDEPENLEIHEIFPQDCLYQTFSIENIQKFTISATREISIESKDIKTLLLLFELDSFYLNSENLIQFSLSFQTPFKMDKINLSKYSINATGKTSKKFKLETSEKKFSVEITKTHKNIEDEMQFCGLGYLTIDDFEYCIIKKIEFLGNFEKDLNGIVKIKFVSNLDKVFPVNYYFPPNLSSIKNVLCDLATVKKNQDEDNFYFLGNLRPKIEHELRFNIQLPGESVEDEWLANLPVSANVGIKPEIDIKVENRNMYINTFPDEEFIKIAIPLKFDPTTGLDKAYPDLFDQISMGAIVFVRQQKLVACQVDETKYELNLDNSLLKVTKTASFDAPVDKEIYVLTENTKKPEKVPIKSENSNQLVIDYGQSIYSNNININNNNTNGDNNNNNINNNSNNDDNNNNNINNNNNNGDNNNNNINNNNNNSDNNDNNNDINNNNNDINNNSNNNNNNSNNNNNNDDNNNNNNINNNINNSDNNNNNNNINGNSNSNFDDNNFAINDSKGAESVETYDDFEIYGDLHFKEITLKNKPNFRAFSIGKMKPNEQFKITSQKKIQIDISDIHFFKFTLMFDTLKDFVKIPYIFKVSSSTYQIKSISIGSKSVNCKNKKSVQFKMESKEPTSNFVIEKFGEDILEKMTSIGSGYLTIDNFELWPINKIEFIGQFTKFLEGRMRILFNHSPYINTHFYHPNPEQKIQNFTSDSKPVNEHENEEEENFFPLILNAQNKEHEIQFDLKLDAEMGEDNWILTFPVTHWKEYDNPSFHFQIENKNILIEKYPFTDSLKVVINYDVTPQTLIKQWNSLLNDVHSFYAVYFDKFDLVPCNLESLIVDINVIEKRYKISKVFSIASKNKKTVYILANRDSKFNWKRNDVKIEVDDVPFDVYSIGSYGTDNNISLSCYKDLFIVDDLVKSASFTIKNDVLKNSDFFTNQAKVHIQSNFLMEAITFSDMKFKFEPSFDYEFESIIAEEEVEVVLFRESINILNEFQNKELGYFTIGNYDIMGINGINIVGNFDDGHFEGQIEYKVEGTQLDDPIYFHSGSNSLHLSNLRIDSIEKDVDDYESIKIGKLELLNNDNLNNNNGQTEQVKETQNEEEEEEYEYEIYEEEEEKNDKEKNTNQQNSFIVLEEEEEEKEMKSTEGSLNGIKLFIDEEDELNATENIFVKNDEGLNLTNNNNNEKIQVNKTKIVKKIKKVKKKGNKDKQGNENNKLNDEIKNCHSIVFDFLFDAELTDDSWEINFPITRFKTIKDPSFHFEIQNQKIIINSLPSEFVHVSIPINNDPSIVFKKWKSAFKCIHFGYAVVLHQMEVIPCTEIEMGYLEANLTKNTIVMKRNFRLPIKFKKEVFIIASKEAEVEYLLTMNKVVVEDVPYNIFSIGTQITKKKFQVLFHRKSFIDNYSIKVCSFIIKNDLLKETEANPNALHNIIHIISSYEKIAIQFDDDEIEQKIETKNFEEEIEVDKEETKVTVYNKKEDEFDEFELRNLGYFTIGEDIKVLDIKDIKIISNFDYGKLEGEITYIVEDSQYKESIYYHEIPSKIEFSNLRVDDKSIEINKIEKETENLIEIGHFEEPSEKHFVKFSFIYEIEMVENDWNIHFPITRFKDRKKNPPFYFEIEDQNIKIDEIPSDDDFIDINISIPDDPEQNLKKWEKVYSNISLGQACFFYQGKIQRCELIRTLIEVDLINNLSHCTKLFKQPKGFGSKQIYFLVSKDIEVENTERKLFKKIELDEYPFDIFLVGFIEPGYEFQLRTLQKLKINDLFIFKKSFVLKNDVIMNELKSKKIKRNKKTKKVVPSPSLIFIHIEADFIISSVECLNQILQNSEESDSFNFSIETNEKEIELKVTKIASDFLSKIKKKGLGYFTICNFDLLMIDEIIITSNFNNNGILSGVIEFKIEGIKFDEDILYYPGSESIHLSNLRLDSEIVIEEEEEEPEMSQSSKSVDTSKHSINLGKIKKFINDNEEQEENQNQNKNENDDDDDDDDNEIKKLSTDDIDEKNKKRYHSVMFDFTYKAEMAEETWEIDFPITRYKTIENPLFLFEVKDPPIRIEKLPKSVVHLSIPINNDPNIIFKKWDKTFKCIFFGFAVFIHQMQIIPLEVIEKGFLEANLNDNTIYMERKFNPPTKPNKTVYIIASKEVEVIVDNSLKLKKIDIDEIPFNIYTLGKKASTKQFKVRLLKNLIVNNKSIKCSYFYYGIDLINDVDPESNSLKSEIHVTAPYKEYTIQIDDNEIVDNVDIQNEETKVTVHNIVNSGINQLDIKNLGYFTIDEDFKLLEIEDIKIISNFDYGKLEGEIKFIVEDCQYEEIIYYHELPSNVQLSNLQIDDENIEINRVTKETENLIEIGHFKEPSEKHFVKFSFTLDNPMVGNNWNILFPITRFYDESQNPPYLFNIENESVKTQEIPYDKDYLEINIEIPDEPEKNLDKWEDIYSNVSLGQSCIFYQGSVKRCELIQTQIEVDLTNEIVHCTKLFKLPLDFGSKRVYFLISKDVDFENPEKKSFKKIKTKEEYPFDIIQAGVFDPGKEFHLKTCQKIQIKNLSINKISFTFNNDVIRGEYEENEKSQGKVSVHIYSNTAIDTVETLGNVYENTEKSNEIKFDYETDENEIKVNVRKGFREYLSKIQLKDLGYFTIDDYELLMIKEIKVQSSFEKGILTGEVEFKVNGTENDDTIFYYFGSKSLELSDLRIDSNPIDFNYDGPNQRKINIGNIVENEDEGEEGVLHSIAFSFQLKAVVNEENWEVTFPITRYSEEAGENPEFSFEETNEKIHVNELPIESLFFTFELIPDPHILLSLVDFDESSIFSLYYLDHLKMEKCQTESTFIDVDLTAKVLNLSHTFEMPKQEKDKREVFLLTKLNEEDVKNTVLTDSEHNYIEKYEVENDNFNAFYIGERNSGSSFTLTIVSEIEIRETSIKHVEFDFVNDSDATFSMKIVSDFSMNQIELISKETSLDFPCFNKKKIEITDQLIKPSVVTCVIEKTKTNIIDGLSYSNLGYFTIDDFCLLPIEKIEFIGNSEDELKGIATFTLKNDYDFNIDVYYAPPPYVHSLLVDETGEVEINSEKIVNISQFGPGEVHFVKFEITIQKTLIEDGDDFKDDDEDEDDEIEKEKQKQKDYIYRFPLTYFTSIQNPEFYFEIENKEIKIDTLPNLPYLEISMITSDLTIHKFDPLEINTNMMNLIFLQGNQEFIGPLTKRTFKATVSEMKASILCDSIYYNPSSYPVRYKIIFNMSLFDFVSSIRINDKIEISKESFTKMVENNRNSYINLNRKILSKGKIKISFTFTTKVEEEVKVSKISFLNEPLTIDHVYIPSHDGIEEGESFIEELKKIVHFEFCNHENTLIPWGEKPCNFTLPKLEARFLFATNKNVIAQHISQCMNGTMIFKLKQQRNYFIFQAKEVHYKCEVTMCEGHAIQKVEMTYKSPLDKTVECIHCIYNDPKSNIKIDGGYADATFLTNEPNFLCFVADNIDPNEEGYYSFTQTIPMTKDSLASKYLCTIPCDANTELVINTRKLSDDPIIKYRPEFLEKNGDDKTGITLSGHVQYSTNLNVKIYYESNLLESLRIACQNSKDLNATFSNISKSYHKLAGVFKRSVELKDKIDTALIGFLNSLKGQKNSIINDQFKVDFNDFSKAFSILADEGNVILKDDPRKSLDIEIEMFNSSFNILKIPDKTERAVILPIYYLCHDVLNKKNNLYINLQLPLNSNKNQIIPLLSIRLSSHVVYISTNSLIRNLIKKKLSSFTKVFTDDQNGVLNFNGEKMIAVFKPFHLIGLFNRLSKDELNEFISKTLFVFDDFDDSSPQLNILIKKIVVCVISLRSSNKLKDGINKFNTDDDNDDEISKYQIKILRISNAKLQEIDEYKILKEEQILFSTAHRTIMKEKTKKVHDLQTNAPFPINARVISVDDNSDALKNSIQPIVHQVLSSGLNSYGPIVIRLPNSKMVNDVNDAIHDEIKAFKSDFY